jgi:serine/threonine-protein kinase
MAPVDDPTIAETPRSAARRRLTEPPERYDIQQLLGEGGMGRVYRAHDTKLGRDVAIKMLDRELQGPDKTQQRERFVREARAAARLLHPNIAVVHDVDADAGWLVMELVEGESLRDVLSRGSLGTIHVRRIAEQVLAALDAAHAAGIIHRDVKPSNIVEMKTGSVKLVDFGVARLVDVEVTRTGESMGTPAYMAPEQLRGGAVDGRTDLYALGATLYELITGNRMIAFESPGPAAIEKIRGVRGWRLSRRPCCRGR